MSRNTAPFTHAHFIHYVILISALKLVFYNCAALCVCVCCVGVGDPSLLQHSLSSANNPDMIHISVQLG